MRNDNKETVAIGGSASFTKRKTSIRAWVSRRSHKNSEFILIREGQIEYLTDGRTEHVGSGDIIFNASLKPHGMRNVGSTTARYFVVSIGEKGDSQEVPLVSAKE